jgi:hypothetical protein
MVGAAMSEKKGWGKSVLGWFVVQEEGEADGSDAPSTGGAAELSADELIAKYAAAEPEPPPPPPVVLSGPLPAVVDGTVDFEQVFDAAGVTSDERDQVRKAKELLESLPAETPAAVKKQIVEASLKAFGVSTSLIIESAVGEMEALEAFIRTGQAQTQQILGDTSKRITELDAEIARLRQSMEQAMQEQKQRTAAANAHKLDIQRVLEFFGEEAVAKVVRESPKLHEPPAEG